MEDNLKRTENTEGNLEINLSSKRDLRLFVLNEIKTKKIDLAKIKKSIEQTWQKSFSSFNLIENAYIDRKYIKYCANFWLDHILEYLKIAVKDGKWQDVFNSLDKFKCINNAPEVLQDSDYYKLLKKHSKLISVDMEKSLINKIINICFEQTFSYNDTIKIELEFLERFSKFLDKYQDGHKIVQLYTTNFINSNVSFNNLLKYIINLDQVMDFDIIPLKELAKNLQNVPALFMVKKVEEVINDYIKPVQVTKKEVENRWIIEVKCRNLRISDILNNVENLLKDSKIVEVQFIITNCFYVDASFNNDIWHGINVVILANDMKIIGTVSWDLSGKNNDHKYESTNGNEEGYGKNGSDGYPGESGGNILIYAMNIIDSENFSLYTNGGNGSHGQDGGNGIDGENGEGISRIDFKNNYPSVVKFGRGRWERQKTVKEAIAKIKENAQTIKSEWYSDFEHPGDGDVYIKVITRQGNKIVFSYCCGGWNKRYQAFLLYKGSLGKPGKIGGEGGFGGEGGYEGNIEIHHLINEQDFNVQKYSKKGENGKVGKGGLYGKHGKNSWDMGYMDYQFWGETVVYDSLESNINIVYYRDTDPNRIWCPYKNNKNQNAYAAMEVHKISHKQQTTYDKENTLKRKERQHYSRAVKKKNVLKSNLDKSNFIMDLQRRNKFEDLKSQLQTFDLFAMQSFAKIQSMQTQEQNICDKIKINRNYYTFNDNIMSNNNHNNAIGVKNNSKTNISIENITNAYKKIPKNVTMFGKWLQLKDHKLNIFQLRSLYSDWNIFAAKFSNKYSDSYLGIENIFLEKYRVAVMQEISRKICDEKTLNKNLNEMTISATDAINYLTESTKVNNSIYHNDLGLLNQYFFDNKQIHRDRVSEYCQEELLKIVGEALKHALSSFILELPKHEIKVKCLIDFRRDYETFLEQKKQNLKKYYNIFRSEVTKLRHENVLQSIVGSATDNIKITQLKKDVQGDPFLKNIYERLICQLEGKYDWNECLKDKNVFKNFMKYIKESGPKSRSYRELLAYIYNVNIRVYQVDNTNHFFLFDNHNEISDNVIYLLYKENRFSEITVNMDEVKLTKKCEYLDLIIYNILSNVYTLNTKNELDEYLQNFTIALNRNLYRKNIIKKFHEEEDIEKIAQYFPKTEQTLIKSKLQKIVSYYTDNLGIINIILRRFESEDRQVSYMEMCYLINFILHSRLKNMKQENMIRWMVATVFQNEWIAELIMMQLESFFKKCLNKKDEFRKEIVGLNNDILMLFGVKIHQYNLNNSVISMTSIKDIFFLLSNIGSIKIDLTSIELMEWPYVLKEYYWKNRLEILFNGTQCDIGATPYYTLSFENMYGTAMVNDFFDILIDKKVCHDVESFIEILKNIHDERWNLGQEELCELKKVGNLKEWISMLDRKFSATDCERDVTQLIHLIRGNSNTSKSILSNLPHLLNILRNISSENYCINGKLIKDFTEIDIKNWVKNFEISSIIDYEEILSVIDRAIQLRRGFKLRHTQRLTILSLLINDKSILAQVSTGEGKSLIVVSVTIIKVIYGEKVDIVTSSSLLAIRDAECNKDIYNLFNIHVSHNCSVDLEKRVEAYSNNSVMYGDLANFQRDYLLDRLYSKNILGDHDFSNVIIDEVDSMLLDKGNNMLYLSHDIAGLDKLQSLYIYIWCSINRPVDEMADLVELLDVNKIKDAVFNDLYGIIKKDDMIQLDNSLHDTHKNFIWNFLINKEIINSDGKLLLKDFCNIDLSELPYYSPYIRERLEYLIRLRVERKRFIEVPEYLKPFIEIHLETWIRSALTAYLMKPGYDYVVDVDRTKTISDRNPVITILDRDTGTDQTNSQWDEALHQFIQIKHGCKVTMQSLKSVFISNVSYFKLYRNLYGLTGTLGSQRERDLLKEIHNVDFVTIPTAKSKKFHEEQPIVCSNRVQWIDSICDNVKKVVIEEKRSILLICQSVNDVELLHKNLNQRGLKYIHTYTRDYEEFDIARGSQMLDKGNIIIATNLAGRGTDILLTDNLKKMGGLHVCLTYLPNNIRIERQAYGRAARCGDEGNGRLIIVDKSYESACNSKVFRLKEDRDGNELKRISLINSLYEHKIKTEETCFEEFKNLYEEIKKKFNEKCVPLEVQEILLQSCLDDWAFWLDKFSSRMGNLENINNKTAFYDSFKIFKKNFQELLLKYCNDNWFYWIKQNPIKILNLGKYFLKEKRYGHAIELFNIIIHMEPTFSEAAHYYKAYAISKEINWEKWPFHDKTIYKQFKKELYEADKLFSYHNECTMINATTIDKIKETYPDSIIKIEAFIQQQNTLCNYYMMYSKSINDILGPEVTFETFVSTNITEELARIIHDDFVQRGILDKAKIKKTFNEADLISICRDFGISTKPLHTFLCKYKGLTVDEEIFVKEIKSEISLPSREEFWKMLLEQKVLFNETKYVIVDIKKLEKVDPSFLELLNQKIKSVEIKSKKVEKDIQYEVFLKEDCLITQEKRHIITLKHEFKSLDPAKYHVFKKSGIITCNKKAIINEDKIITAQFSKYDTIASEDFTKININLIESREILEDLAKKGYIEKNGKDKKGLSYKLNLEFDKIIDIKFESCSIYTNSIQALLYSTFAYRIALQKLKYQIKDNKNPIHFQLMCKPHHQLVFELLEQRLIKPIRVSTSSNTKKKVRDLYSISMTKEQFLQLLTHSKIISKTSASELFHDLLSKQWIVPYNTIYEVAKKTIWDNTEQYEINKLKEKRQGLSSSYTHIEKSLHIVLDNQLKLREENSIVLITRILDNCKSSIKSLEVPHNNLKPLIEYLGTNKFLNVDELRIMFLNGLDQVQIFQEKKYTTKMLISTGFIFIMGICQIVLGYFILLYSVGFMTHVANIAISEGVSDMLYATNALRIGHFSWNNYKNHKLISIMFSAVTVGVGALFSRTAIYSRFGQKLFGPTCQINGKSATEVCGNQLIKTIGSSGCNIYNTVLKDIAVHTVKSMSLCFANYVAQSVTEKYLHSFCENIGTIILSNIEEELDNHKLSSNLQELFVVYGENKAKKVVIDLTESFFLSYKYEDRLLASAMRITNSVTTGIMQALSKNNASTTLQFSVNCLNLTLVWANRIKEISMITSTTKNLLDGLDQEIKRTIPGEQNHSIKENFEISTENYENFKLEIINHWRGILRQQAGRVIAQHVVAPILEEVLNKLLKYVGNNLKKMYEFKKERDIKKRYTELRDKYKNDLDENKIHGKESKTINEELTKQFHADLVNLMKETKCPKLLATIILEKVPMDLTCFLAAAPVIRTVLKEHGIEIPGLTIAVTGENGISQEILIGPKGIDNKTIHLELKDNHYQLVGSDVILDDSSSAMDNDCLYKALVTGIPELSILGKEKFRSEIARCISTNPEIQLHILNGWHRMPINLNLYGGARKRVNRINDPESTEQESIEIHKHLVDRFMRVFRLVGTVQRISNKTNIPRREVVKGGASQYQDQSSKMGIEYHAAHVVRGVISSGINQDQASESFIELSNILGHTQIVDRFANEWHGLGGDIDRFQSRAFDDLTFVDFTANSPVNEFIINSIKTDYLNEISKYCDSDKVSDSNKYEIYKAIHIIENSKTENIFEKGVDGYTGKYKYSYLP